MIVGAGALRQHCRVWKKGAGIVRAFGGDDNLFDVIQSDLSLLKEANCHFVDPTIVVKCVTKGFNVVGKASAFVLLPQIIFFLMSPRLALG